MPKDNSRPPTGLASLVNPSQILSESSFIANLCVQPRKKTASQPCEVQEAHSAPPRRCAASLSSPLSTPQHSNSRRRGQVCSMPAHHISWHAYTRNSGIMRHRLLPSGAYPRMTRLPPLQCESSRKMASYRSRSRRISCCRASIAGRRRSLQ